MNDSRNFRFRRSEAGVALLIALFALLLISAVGLALVVSSGTETSLAGNYRASSGVFYAASAGLEEGRGRLSRLDPNYFGAFVATPGTPLPLGQVRYIRNPLPGETVDPLAAGSAYEDTEYIKEFKVAPNPVNTQYINSVWPKGGMQGPVYKWVRINTVTEQSLGIDVDKNNVIDLAPALAYDGASLNRANRGDQALGITALAVLPDGSRKILQYVVAHAAPIPVDSAVHTLLSQVMGDALNVTGFTDPVCTLASTPGATSGQTVTIPGSGNVSGAPTATVNNALFPYKLPAIIKSFKGQSQPIDSPGTGVTGTGPGTPASGPYIGPHATLGVPPTLNLDSTGAITAITSPGASAVYISPGDLTLGVAVKGGAPVSGQGVLIVQGNLSIDITNGFNYYGLIVVTGDITMTADPSTSAYSNVHGAIIGGGKFTSNLANLSGSIFIHQNACMVQNQITLQALTVLSFREIPQ